jgi:hypothetical protein
MMEAVQTSETLLIYTSLHGAKTQKTAIFKELIILHICFCEMLYISLQACCN